MIWISGASKNVGLPLKPLEWVVPPKSVRFMSAVIDSLIWFVIALGAHWFFSQIAHTALGLPNPTPDPRDDIFYISFGPAALCANLYLGIANGTGRSLGKFLCGLRLVVPVGQYPAKPGFARGLVRSALQAGPAMGILMYSSDAHDDFAGTRVIKAVNDADVDEAWNLDPKLSGIPVPPPIAIWKIALAIFLHLFFVPVYIFLSAA